MILEYADVGSLEDLFQQRQPPSTAEDVCDFWTAILGLTEALYKLHHIVSGESSDPSIFQGLVDQFF